MLRRNALIALTSLAIAASSFAASAAVVFTNLAANAPPTTLGSHALTPFAIPPQAAIGEFTSVSTIPGNPFGGQLEISPNATKYTATSSWGTDAWPGSYVGPIYFSGFGQTSATFSLPTGTTAFYFYTQGNGDTSGVDTVTVTTNSGTTSGPVLVQTEFFGSNVGANGFAFHSTAGEVITSITVQSNNFSGFAVGNFGIDAGSATTCASEGYKGAQLTWCKNICENSLSGQVLDTWIHRWTNRYRDLPYCAVEQPEDPRGNET